MIATCTQLTMLGLFAAATPLTSDDPALWAHWGLAGLVVGYVMWRDWQREKRLGAAIERQQAWIRETLVAALERNAGAMERMVAWLERNNDRA
jgi:hypothetical protein